MSDPVTSFCIGFTAGFLSASLTSYIIATLHKAIGLYATRLRTKRMKERAAGQVWEDWDAFRVDVKPAIVITNVK